MKVYSAKEIKDIVSEKFNYEEDLTLDYLFNLVDKIADDGCIVYLKFDGQRSELDNGRYTVICRCGPLGEESINGDFSTVTDGLYYLIGNYFSLYK